tara:strand:+ start:1876 stop:4284 length:2409 start_codon:yes stop_codon:yes gene_type:complete
MSDKLQCKIHQYIHPGVLNEVWWRELIAGSVTYGSTKAFLDCLTIEDRQYIVFANNGDPFTKESWDNLHDVSQGVNGGKHNGESVNKRGLREGILNLSYRHNEKDRYSGVGVILSKIDKGRSQCNGRFIQVADEPTTRRFEITKSENEWIATFGTTTSNTLEENTLQAIMDTHWWKDLNIICQKFDSFMKDWNVLMILNCSDNVSTEASENHIFVEYEEENKAWNMAQYVAASFPTKDNEGNSSFIDQVKIPEFLYLSGEEVVKASVDAPWTKECFMEQEMTICGFNVKVKFFRNGNLKRGYLRMGVAYGKQLIECKFCESDKKSRAYFDTLAVLHIPNLLNMCGKVTDKAEGSYTITFNMPELVQESQENFLDLFGVQSQLTYKCGNQNFKHDVFNLNFANRNERNGISRTKAHVKVEESNIKVVIHKRDVVKDENDEKAQKVFATIKQGDTVDATCNILPFWQVSDCKTEILNLNDKDRTDIMENVLEIFNNNLKPEHLSLDQQQTKSRESLLQCLFGRTDIHTVLEQIPSLKICLIKSTPTPVWFLFCDFLEIPAEWETLDTIDSKQIETINKMHLGNNSIWDHFRSDEKFNKTQALFWDQMDVETRESMASQFCEVYKTDIKNYLKMKPKEEKRANFTRRKRRVTQSKQTETVSKRQRTSGAATVLDPKMATSNKKNQLQENERLIKEQAEKIKGNEKLNNQQAKAIKEKNAAITEKNAEIRDLKKQIKGNEKINKQQANIIKGKDEEIIELKRVLAEANDFIEESKNKVGAVHSASRKQFRSELNTLYELFGIDKKK